MRFLYLLSFFVFINADSIAQTGSSDNVTTFKTYSDESLRSVIFDTAINYYEYGRMDAKRFYKGYKKAATLTILSGTGLMLVSPVAGLTTAIACSSTPPKIKNLNLPDSILAQNEDYLAGYKRQSKKIKQKKVWKNWAIGFVINVSIVGLILFVPGK